MSESEDMNKKFEKFITELEDGNFEVKDRKGNKYILEEGTGEDLEKAQDISTKMNKTVELILLKKMLIEPKLSDDDIRALPTSTYTRLKLSVGYITGLTDFL